MSQPRINLDAFREHKRRRKMVREHLHGRTPIVTLLMVDDKVRAVAVDRGVLAKWAETNSIVSFDMVDHEVIS